ncbi:MAG: serine/threonine protein kinase [Pirellulales bacterium]|nr:serine/threonine protein kinase [Pirellulales bacterium]
MFHLIRAGSTYEIWTVRPMVDNTPYAMKWLPPGDKYTRESVVSLRHEYSVGKSFDHPDIIRVHEFGTSKDGAFLVMELFRAPNLKQWINQGLETIHYRLREVLINTATALAHVHERGWIHRDVKPDNFLLDQDNQIRLIDFNLSQRRQGALNKLLSGRSKVQGTHSYISPEQIRGQAIDHRADIYSFGCMVHECVNGKPPFTATSANELLNKHLKSKPPLLTVGNKNIEPAFAELVQAMLTKDAKDRIQSLDEFLREMKTCRIFRISPQPPPDQTEGGAPVASGD